MLHVIVLFVYNDVRCIEFTFKILLQKRQQREEKNTVINSDELQLLKDQIDHLLLLRNNLEASVAAKEDVITDLQMQIDFIVSDAEESSKEVEMCHHETDLLKKEVNFD